MFNQSYAKVFLMVNSGINDINQFEKLYKQFLIAGGAPSSFSAPLTTARDLGYLIFQEKTNDKGYSILSYELNYDKIIDEIIALLEQKSQEYLSDLKWLGVKVFIIDRVKKKGETQLTGILVPLTFRINEVKNELGVNQRKLLTFMLKEYMYALLPLCIKSSDYIQPNFNLYSILDGFIHSVTITQDFDEKNKNGYPKIDNFIEHNYSKKKEADAVGAYYKKFKLLCKSYSDSKFNVYKVAGNVAFNTEKDYRLKIDNLMGGKTASKVKTQQS